MSPSWTDFLSILAQASVSMLALLFVSFQIARERWVSKAPRRLVAIQTLLEFLVPSFFAIIALLPINSFPFLKIQFYQWQIAGFLLSICGLFVSGKILQYNRKNTDDIDEFFKKQVKLQWVSLFEYLLVMWFSIDGNLFCASLMMIWLLLSGSYETWLFFAELDEKPNNSKKDIT